MDVLCECLLLSLGADMGSYVSLVSGLKDRSSVANQLFRQGRFKGLSIPFIIAAVERPAFSNRLERILVLVDDVASVSSGDGETLLHAAARCVPEDESFVRALLSRMPARLVGAADATGMTAERVAMRAGHARAAAAIRGAWPPAPIADGPLRLAEWAFASAFDLVAWPSRPLPRGLLCESAVLLCGMWNRPHTPRVRAVRARGGERDSALLSSADAVARGLEMLLGMSAEPLHAMAHDYWRERALAQNAGTSERVFRILTGDGMVDARVLGTLLAAGPALTRRTEWTECEERLFASAILSSSTEHALIQCVMRMRCAGLLARIVLAFCDIESPIRANVMRAAYVSCAHCHELAAELVAKARDAGGGGAALVRDAARGVFPDLCMCVAACMVDADESAFESAFDGMPPSAAQLCKVVRAMDRSGARRLDMLYRRVESAYSRVGFASAVLSISLGAPWLGYALDWALEGRACPAPLARQMLSGGWACAGRARAASLKCVLDRCDPDDAVAVCRSSFVERDAESLAVVPVRPGHRDAREYIGWCARAGYAEGVWRVARAGDLDARLGEDLFDAGRPRDAAAVLRAARPVRIECPVRRMEMALEGEFGDLLS
jgi:hypothetical protein